MKTEILRYLFMALPYTFCSTLSALILFGEDIRKLFPRLTLFSLLAGLTQTLSCQFEQAQIQFLLEVVSGFLVARLVFQKQLSWVFKIYAASYILGILYICVLVTPASLVIFQAPHAQTMNDPHVWLTFLVPANVLLVLIAVIIKKSGLHLKKLDINLGNDLERPYPIFIAILIQLIIFTCLGGQVLNQPGYSENYYVIAITFVIISVAIFMSFYIVLKYFQRTNVDVAVYSQEVISENIMELIYSVKGQRHDYLNHLQVIYGMAHQNKIRELNEYLENLLQEISFYSEIFKIDNPIISALINAKVSQANLLGVNIQVDIQTAFTGFQVAAMNIARILANLIDNAVDAVLNDDVAKNVEVKIAEQGPLLLCIVKNPSTTILDEAAIFDAGFSSKEEHSGLGLYNCRKLAERLHGNLRMVQDQEQVSFALTVPRQ